MDNQVDKNSEKLPQRADLYRKKQHPVLKIILMFILTITFAGSAYAFKMWNDTVDTANTIFQPLANKKVSTAVKDEKPICILLMGLDNGTEDRQDVAHSDTMIVATVNQKNKQTTLVSIPRDTMAELQGTLTDNASRIQKINSGYTFGGAEVAVATVENLLNVPIDYYISVDMGALEQIVDAVGGVEVDSPLAFYYDGRGFVKGVQKIDGKGALSYSRMRHEDPDGDYGRQKRQQQVIEALIKKAVSFDTLANFQSVLTTIKKDMKTNLTFNNMMDIQENYRAAAKKVVSTHIQGQDAWIGDGSYQIASPDELNKASSQIRTQLGLSVEPLDNEEIRQYNLNTTFTGESPNNIFTIYPTDADDES